MDGSNQWRPVVTPTTPTIKTMSTPRPQGNFRRNSRFSRPWIDSYPISTASMAPISIWTTPQRPTSSNISKKPQIWGDWIDLSTFHGIIELRKYGKVWKATWVIVMIAFTALAIYNIEESISQFIANPTVQNYKEEVQNTFPFPDIAICAHERLNFSVLKSMGASPALIQGLKNEFEMYRPTFVLQQRGSDIWMNNDTPRLYAAFRAKNGNITYEDIQRKARFECVEMVEGCSWSLDTAEGCCKDARPFLDRQNGQCYRFRTGMKNQDGSFFDTQTWPGRDGGFLMALKPIAGASMEGVLVEIIHPNESNSFTYFHIPAGVVAGLQVSLQVTDRINIGLGRPQTCVESSYEGPPYNSDNRITMDALRESANGCYFVCWSKAVYKYCKCAFLPNIAGYPLCEPYDECPNNNTDNILAEYQRLRSECLPQCHRRSYAVSISYSKFNAAVYYKRFNTSSEDISSENLMILDVYHPQMDYLHIVEVEVYSIMTLVSNIGGALGLWLGASLMSILQLVFYFIKWVSLRNCTNQRPCFA